jgi:hypothetical protein
MRTSDCISARMFTSGAARQYWVTRSGKPTIFNHDYTVLHQTPARVVAAAAHGSVMLAVSAGSGGSRW